MTDENSKLSREQIEHNLHSCEFSEARFLGTDESLADVVSQDLSTLATLGLSMADLANFMDSLRTVYVDHRRDAMQASMQHVKEYTVEYKLSNISYIVTGEKKEISLTGVSYLGYQYCPFGCKNTCSYADTTLWIAPGLNTVVRDSSQENNQLQFGVLLSHLAREHSFLEGRDLTFRVDPARWSEFFGLAQIKRANPSETFENFFQRGSGDPATTTTVVESVCEYEPFWMRMLKFLSGRGGLVWSN